MIRSERYKIMDFRRCCYSFYPERFYENNYKAIAELAGVSESTFFRIYKSKAALLSDLLYIMTPGPEDIPMKEMTNGTDIRKDLNYSYIITPSSMCVISRYSVWLCMWKRFMTSPAFLKSKG